MKQDTFKKIGEKSISVFEKNSDSDKSVNLNISFKIPNFKYKKTLSGTNSYSSPYSKILTNFTENKNKPAVSSDKLAKYIVKLVTADEFIEGEVSRTELYLEKLYLEDEVSFREIFQKVWLSLFQNNDSRVLSTFISICSGIEYEWFGLVADGMIIGATAHADIYVNESAIRAIEAWEQPKFIGYLANIRPFEVEWLNEYKTMVMSYLENF